MTRAVKLRLLAFVVLSAVGIVYIAAVLPRPRRQGPRPRLHRPRHPADVRRPLRGQRGDLPRHQDRQGGLDGTRPARASTSSSPSRTAYALPLDSPMYVHNLSAVGEQYLDFEPPDDEGPYAEDGSRAGRLGRRAARRRGRPARRARQLRQLRRPAQPAGADQRARRHVRRHRATAAAADRRRRRVHRHRCGQHRRRPSSCSTPPAPCCAPSATTATTSVVLRATSPTLTDALRDSDGDIRTVLDDTPPAAREITALLDDLGPRCRSCSAT